MADRPGSDKASLEQWLQRKGYRHAVVLGPFGGHTAPVEYTISVYDPTGRTYLETRRDTPEALRDWIADLPAQGGEGR